jgi:hypothetical protein
LGARFSAVKIFFCIFLVQLALVSNTLNAQRIPFRNASEQAGTTLADGSDAEFHFTRLIYGGNGFDGGFRSRGSWTTDWPEAEHFFMEGLTRLTLVKGRQVSVFNGSGGQRLSLADESIFDFPFLYAVEVGRWSLSTQEIVTLREYLQRGGFMITDDFHGSEEWSGFINVMQRVFPDRPIVDIPDNDEVFHVLYDLDERIQIPGLAALYNGMTHERDGVDPHWRGIYDEEGRLMVVINHNMDLGDAWEHADTPGYPEPMTAMAYRFAVNYVIYAMTH